MNIFDFFHTFLNMPDVIKEESKINCEIITNESFYSIFKSMTKNGDLLTDKYKNIFKNILEWTDGKKIEKPKSIKGYVIMFNDLQLNILYCEIDSNIFICRDVF